MDIQESLCFIFDALTEIKKAVSSHLLTDFVMGKESDVILKKHFEELETFGCGSDQSDDSYYKQVIDKALELSMLKDKDGKLVLTAKGKKFLKKPTPVIINDEDDAEDSPIDSPADPLAIDSLMEDAIKEKGALVEQSNASRKSAKKIHLIQAIDRKVALDDYAEQEGLAFDELMDELEEMIDNGTKLNIKYFGIEVLGDDCLNELSEFLDDENGNTTALSKEYGDVYNTEELRLAYIIWKAGN